MNAARRREIHALMVRFADGERAAFRPLFDALWPVLLAVASRGLPDRAEAEDAAQRAMLVVFQRIVDFDRERDGAAWAVAIAAFEVMTSRRRAARRREEPGGGERLDAIEDRAPPIDEQLVIAELRLAVHEAVGELPARDRDALAPILDEVPLLAGETPRKRRSRALERLRAIWRKTHG